MSGSAPHERIYRLYDRCSETCIGQVMLCQHDAPAIRTFHDVMKDEKTLIAQHPEDFELICIGMAAPDGQIVSTERRVVATGVSFVTSAPALVREGSGA